MFSMFSMFSQINPCSPIRYGKMQQLVDSCMEVPLPGVHSLMICKVLWKGFCNRSITHICQSSHLGQFKCRLQLVVFIRVWIKSSVKETHTKIMLSPQLSSVGLILIDSLIENAKKRRRLFIWRLKVSPIISVPESCSSESHKQTPAGSFALQTYSFLICSFI